MGLKNPEDEALDRILGDMDGMESNRMFGGDKNKGVSITISVTPQGGEDDGEGDDYPEGHDASMCGGGCAYHAGGPVEMLDLAGKSMKKTATPMNAGGLITDPGIIDEEKDLAGNKPHKFSKGGIVEDEKTGHGLIEDDTDTTGAIKSKGDSRESPEEDESKLPPFLRKKKKPLQDA